MTNLNSAFSGRDTARSQVKIRMLHQMAEALEDEAAGLCHRAMAFEGEEHSLDREIKERETEINRLQLKLDGLRSERGRLIEKAESLRDEASALREQALNRQEAPSLATPGKASVIGEPIDGDYESPLLGAIQFGRQRRSVYFQRLTLTDYAG